MRAGGLSYNAEAEAGRRARTALQCSSLPVLSETSADTDNTSPPPLRPAAEPTTSTTSEPHLRLSSSTAVMQQGRDSESSPAVPARAVSSNNAILGDIQSAPAVYAAFASIGLEVLPAKPDGGGQPSSPRSMTSSSFNRHMDDAARLAYRRANTMSAPAPPPYSSGATADLHTSSMPVIPLPVNNISAVISPFAAPDIQVPNLCDEPLQPGSSDTCQKTDRCWLHHHIGSQRTSHASMGRQHAAEQELCGYAERA